MDRGHSMAGVLVLVMAVALSPRFAGAEVPEPVGGEAEIEEALPDLDSMDLDFDFLGEAQVPEPSFDDALLGRRRTLLKVHQGVGLAMLGLMAGTMVSGQLNYNDYYGGPQTARYAATHRWLARGTSLTFLTTGALALFAPVPTDKRHAGVDRVLLHKIGLYGASAGMITQAVLGMATVRSRGLERQDSMAGLHLGLGYATMAMMALGVGALVF